MRLVFGSILSLCLASCSSTVPKAYLPVDSPLRAWAAPEQDEPTAPTPAPAPAAKPEKKPAKGATR